MGSGKGSPEFWVAVIKPGRVLFELGGINRAAAAEALKLASTQACDQNKVCYPYRLSGCIKGKVMKAHELRQLLTRNC